jgi:hypothetical protein
MLAELTGTVLALRDGGRAYWDALRAANPEVMEAFIWASEEICDRMIG